MNRNKQRSVYIYVGAGWDTTPFDDGWTNGGVFHCIDGQPNSEFGTQTYFEDGCNLYARRQFVARVLKEYHEAGFICSDDDKQELLNTQLLDERGTGLRRVVMFENTERDICIWYHFNTGLPDHIPVILDTLAINLGNLGNQAIPVYNGLLCGGHWPHKSIMDAKFQIPDNSLTFHGYAKTCFGVDCCDLSDVEGTVCGRLSYDYMYRRKFKEYIFHDLNGEEHWFNSWEEYLVWINHNSNLAYE